ncbi:MAG: 50S ribosomal protein L29 [Candidatus Yanofskybacteria bacterium RIFCSPHIGHO2_01_FULL_42_12]|uniref:Large ribosomal subunit protein uL29 n=1 Tax=Candidatus Yanofskybacteria bacterium RIFCSPLOWO2_01_FULL_42_49 TaxID=1802694 RepID=A0A1F8GEK4_9BACT|nr:MAG: 50S ribosomal protein L29 [Candidatus Yanofskybacteria bacterium RIFCSPHIGHO2_01_FULL_42_12]OGN23480.1 MAG: 50S ribosomal protein L29 [Candidatus Yanofskybacteria bacterium RIFCSPLOWO2_01_FULL_42_49]
MKSTDLKNKTSKELEGSLSDLKIKLAKISFELEAHALKDTSQIKKIKKDIARILTLLKSQNSQTLNPKL